MFTIVHIQYITVRGFCLSR